MFRRFTKKRYLVALTAVAALAITGGAIAYLTASGSGSGSGSVTASSSALTLSISNAPALTNIGDQETYDITAANTGSSPEHVTGITVSSIVPSSAAQTAGCPPDSFSAGTPTLTGNEVPAGSVATPGTAVVGHVVVTFNDDTTHAQNGCIGTGTVSIGLSST
jgi:uncharacterized repeat protein (TIGR01451 family)